MVEVVQKFMKNFNIPKRSQHELHAQNLTGTRDDFTKADVGCNILRVKLKTLSTRKGLQHFTCKVVSTERVTTFYV